MDLKPNSNQTVLITGANRGIGLAMLRECLALEYKVIATVRDLEKADDLKTLQEKFPDHLSLRSLDVTSDASAQKLADAIPKLDILINNAAIFPENGDEKVQQWKMSDLTEAFATNVVGTARITQALLPLLKKSSTARVVNISSSAGSINGRSSSDYYAYATSKAALNMLVRTMAFDLQNYGIIAVAVHPGWVQTEMGGSDATLTPRESASAIVKMLASLTPQDAGCFLERDGSPARCSW